MPNRPIFRDEVLGAVGGDFTPQYTATSDQQNLTNLRFTLINPTTEEGTSFAAGMMNNLFDFDNPFAVRGAKMRTIGLGTDNIEVRYEEPVTGVLIARSIAVRQASPLTWAITEELYDGATLIQSRGAIYAYVGGEWEATIT